MPESATPEGAPDSGALIGDRVEHVMGLLNVPSEKPKDEPQGEPEAEQPEPEAAQPETDAGEGEGETESDEAPEPEQIEETPQTYRVRVDGDEVEVTLDELMKGYSRTEDYKRKTARVAEDRREQERLMAEIQQQRVRAVEEYANIVNNASQDAAILAQWNSTDRVKLAREDPAEYNALREQAEQAAHRMALARQHLEQEQVSSLNGRQARSHEVLTERLPEWRDNTKRPELQKKIFESLASYGYSPQELSQLVDYRAVLVAHDAMMYRLSQTAKATAKNTLQQKQVQQPPKVVANPVKRVATTQGEDSERLKALRKRANQSNRIHDRMDYVMEKLARSS